MKSPDEVTPKIDSSAMLAQAEGTLPLIRGTYSPSGRVVTMTDHIPPPTPGDARSAKDRVRSMIVYEFQSKVSPNGSHEPDQINKGRFAKVYRVKQRSDGKDLREVAIKILHNTARHADHNLLQQEIELLKEISSVLGPYVVNVLDIVHLRPMIMCGCGRVYHPLCPACGKHPLQRKEESDKSDEYPSLVCPDHKDCKYEVSAMNVEMQYKKLTGPRTKTCCTEGPHANEGTIINFVDRPAVIMELEEARLDEVAQRRSTYFQERCQQFRTAVGKTSAYPSYGRTKQVLDQVRLKRAAALDKMMLMVQMAEAVAQLHVKEIIHKDLTPDNVMVNFDDNQSPPTQAQRREAISFQDLLNDLVSYPTFSVKIIDFGLADRQKLSRKWYEEKDIINAGMDKAPYFSPEAKQRIQVLNFPLSIDSDLKRFVIPHELKNSITGVHEGDTLTFQWDRNHDHDLLVKVIEPGPMGQGVSFGYFEGQPPAPKQQQGIQMVLPLGEPHDIYSVGALFYYILTGDHLQVNNLSGFVNVLQTHPCELTAAALLRRHGDSYIVHRDAIPIPDRHWRDRVMELILRAMVRGRPHSFNKSRSERGSRPAQELLWATKRLYHGMQQQILAEPRIRAVGRTALPAISAALLACLFSGYAVAKYHLGSAEKAVGPTTPPPAITQPLQPPTPAPALIKEPEIPPQTPKAPPPSTSPGSKKSTGKAPAPAKIVD